MRHALTILLVLFAAPNASADEALRIPLDLEHAVEYALSHHPAMRAQAAAEAIRGSQVELARAGYLPQLELSLQLNGGTGNVLRGSAFPLRNIPNVSGPPTGRSLGDAALGSSLGVGASWDALGLPQRMASVDAALADRAEASAYTQARRLALGFSAADQFLDVLIRAETVRAAEASVQRARVLCTIVKALVDQELRPGAELSRASAELALASTELIRAQQAEAVSRAELASSLGLAGTKIELRGGRLLEHAQAAAPSEAHKHPLLAQADAIVSAAQARKHAVDLQYLPRLDLVAALWTRGSGLVSGAVPPSPGAGIVPDTANWAAGIVLSWPALELVATRARSRLEAAQVRVADARRSELALVIQAQIDSARALLDGGRRIADNMPIALGAAAEAEKQASARYRGGLTTVVEVAEAQRLLAQTEIDDAVARLNVHRARLLLARAMGDLEPFIRDAREGQP